MADGHPTTHATTVVAEEEQRFISEPNFPINLAAILPCYRESEEELRVSIGNYRWRHCHKMTSFWGRNELVPSVNDDLPDPQDEHTQKLLSLVPGMCLFIVVDGSCDILRESSTLQSVRKILNIEDAAKHWPALDGICRFKEIDGVFGWNCNVVVIVKTQPDFRGKRYSQSLCCRLLIRMTLRYPESMKLQFVLLCDADTGFRARDVAQSIERLLCAEDTGLVQVNRRLLNHSFLNMVATLQYLEYNLITMKRKTHCGLGFLAEIDGSFIMMRFRALIDVVEDYSTLLPLDGGSICKVNASNLGEDTLMARMLNYSGWSVDQLTDCDTNHYLNGVTTLHDLFGQRRRWYSNGLSHMMSDLMPFHEAGIWNFPYRPLPRFLLHLLWLLIGGSIGIVLFIEPGLYLFLWTLTALFLFPSLSPLLLFSFFAVLMTLHFAVSFKQNPRDRVLWIQSISFLCFLFTFISWICMAIGFLTVFEIVDLGVDTGYFGGYLLYSAVAVAPNLIQFLSYFALFNHRQGHLILSTYLLTHIMGGFAVYGFALNIWVIANYFDTEWGTREDAASPMDSIQMTAEDAATGYFPNLNASKRPSLMGIPLCCPRIFQFVMPLIQLTASSVLGFGTLNLAIGGPLSLGIFVWPVVQTLIFVLFMISAKCIEGTKVSEGTECKQVHGLETVTVVSG